MKMIGSLLNNNKLENDTKFTDKAADLRSLTPICKKIFKVNQHQIVLHSREKSFIRQPISIANYLVLFPDIPVPASVFTNHQADEFK